MKTVTTLIVLLIVTSLTFALDNKNRITDNQAEFRISGMTCAGCAAKVEKAIRRDEIVSDVQVDWENGLAVVNFMEEMNPDEYNKFFSRIKVAGFTLEHITDSNGETWSLKMTCCGAQVCKLNDDFE